MKIVKVLLLGGTGAIGVYLSKLLLERGDDVYVTSRSSRHDEKIHYLCGDAHDITFLEGVLKQRFDVIVDFMVYTTQEFSNQFMFLLNATNQYLFLSSARVFADSKVPITENSPRLLDLCKDDEYLKTDEYALTKARQENYLFNSGKTNWTIVRPYITFGSNRLQLGVLEKEHWLSRALTNRTVLFQRDIAAHVTTLTYGRDVSNMILHIIGNSITLGKAVNVIGDESTTWANVFKLYREVYKNTLGYEFKYQWQDSAEELSHQVHNEYQVKYDRLFDREFDNSFVKEICGDDYWSTSIKDGLSECLEEFLNSSRFFSPLDWRFQGWADKICGEKVSISEIPGLKNKTKYELTRFGIL